MALKLTLTNDDGLVLAEYSIGGEREYDIEDLDAKPLHDIYIGNDDEEFSLEEVEREIFRAWEHTDGGTKDWE